MKSRTVCINSVRGLLRGFGYRLPKGSTDHFADRFQAVELPGELKSIVTPLVVTIRGMTARIKRLDVKVKALSKEYPIVKSLQSITGVGPIVSTAFVLCIEDPERFKDSRNVAAFLGLRPMLRESSDCKRQGRITKEGDSMMRWLLVQAAHSLIRSKEDSDLKRWVEKLIKRIGKKKAVVALARKLAVLMHYLWLTGVAYDPLHNAKKEERMNAEPATV